MNLRTVIALMFSGAFVVVLPMLFFKAIPAENRDILTYMLGQLSGFVGGIVAYHFASTATSEKKNDQLIDLAAASTPGPTETRIINGPNDPVPVEEPKP